MDDQHTVSTLLARFLRDGGLNLMFAYPGDPIIEVLEASRAAGIEVVLARREGTAAVMAEAVGQLTGRPGVCLSTLGPGSTAMVGGVASAYLDRSPVLALSGQIETSREPYFTHQVADHNRLYSSITKWAGRVEPAAAATVLRKAIRTAVAERPGPVHLTINGDAAKTTVADPSAPVPPLSEERGLQVFRPAGDTGDPRARVRAARRPVVLAGIGALRAGATDALVALAEGAGLPVVVSPMAKGVVPEEHPCFAGVLDMACNQVVWDLLDQADLVVAAGFDAVELIKPWKVTAPVLHVDALPNTDQIYAADVELVGGIPGILRWLLDGLGDGERWTEAEISSHRATLRDAYYAGRVEGHLNPTDVVDVARAAAPRDSIVTTDVGSHKLLVGQGWTTHAPRTSLMSNGLSAMGYSLPAAIAAQLVHRDRPVVCTVGDGGFAMTQGELQLASELGLGLAVIVFCDNSLNRIELKQQALGYPSTATRIASTDVVGLATAMGCDAERATDGPSLEKSLAGLGSLSRPLVIEAVVDPSQYESQF